MLPSRRRRDYPPRVEEIKAQEVKIRAQDIELKVQSSKTAKLQGKGYYSVESSGHNEMTREEQHGQDQGDLREEGNSQFLLAETREWPPPTGSGAEGGPGGSRGPGSL